MEGCWGGVFIEEGKEEKGQKRRGEEERRRRGKERGWIIGIRMVGGRNG